MRFQRLGTAPDLDQQGFFRCGLMFTVYFACPTVKGIHERPETLKKTIPNQYVGELVGMLLGCP